MTTLLVLQHHQAEGVGRIAKWAALHGIELDCQMAPTYFDQPIDFGLHYDGLIILGGPMNVEDNPPWMQHERALINQVVTQQKPILAICLGAQLLAAELGAKIKKLPQAELGWQEVLFFNQQIHGQVDTETSLLVPQWHSQAFHFSSQLLAAINLYIQACSALTSQQIYQNGTILGLQFHPEWDEATLVNLRQAFGAECPFQTVSNTKDQLALESWFFDKLSQLFLAP